MFESRNGRHIENDHRPVYYYAPKNFEPIKDKLSTADNFIFPAIPISALLISGVSLELGLVTIGVGATYVGIRLCRRMLGK